MTQNLVGLVQHAESCAHHAERDCTTAATHIREGQTGTARQVLGLALVDLAGAQESLRAACDALDSVEEAG